MSLQKKTVSAIKWSSLSQFGTQGIAFIVVAILARLLSPSDYGLIGMATVVIGFMNLFKDLGTCSAIIQKPNPSDVLLTSVFWVNVGFGSFCMFFTAILSPLISLFFHEPRLTIVMQVLSVTFFISSLSIVQYSLLQKKLSFNTIAKVDLSASLVSGTVGISMAISGFGVWSLVFQSISSTLVTTSLLWISLRWRPQFIFSWLEVKAISSYSLNLIGHTGFNYFVRNADYVLIGRYLGTQELGYYTLAYRLMLYPMRNVSYVIGRVLFPAFSKIQDDNALFRKMFLKISPGIALITFPMFLGIWVVADLLILTVIGKKWFPVVILLRILAPVGLIHTFGSSIASVYQAKGRTDLFFRWGVLTGVIMVVSYVIGLRWGIVGVAWAFLSAALILAYPLFAIPFRLIGLNFNKFLYAIFRPFACSAIMLTSLVLIKAQLPVHLQSVWGFSIIVSLGIIIYGMATWMLNKEYLLEMIGNFRGD